MTVTTRAATRALALLLTAALAAAWFARSVSVEAQERRTVWDKVYTAQQAALGKVEYDTHCAGCHRPDLSGRDGGGEGPQLAGAAFTKKWDLQSVSQLYTEVSTRMPRNQPRTLTAEAYLNVVAYVLQANKFPAGDEPLKADASLASTFISPAQQTKAAAPQAIGTGTLVQVVGCLDSTSGGWTLTQATPMVRTENPDASPADQLAKLASMPVGSGTLRLLGVYAPLDDQKGRRMEAKGFVVKDPDGDRLNVVSLETVAPLCGK